MRFLLRWLSNVVALFVAAAVIPVMDYGDAGTLVVAALVFALANVFLKPLVILLTLPAVILSLGLAIFFVNALMLWLTDRIVGGFEVGGFWSLMGGTLVVSLVNLALSGLRHPERRPRPRPA